MNSRSLLMSCFVLCTACSGGLGDRPWDKNRDGLVGECEGLNRPACDADPKCRPEPLGCIALCVPDGRGGCDSPCADDFVCLPRSCEQLSGSDCSADPRCYVPADVTCAAVCEPDGRGGCLPCDPGPLCRTRPAPDCASLPLGMCAVVPACEIQTRTVCTAGDHATGVAPPEERCGGGCSTTQVCAHRVAPPPPARCEALPLDVCLSNPRCEIASGPVCEIACLGADCPPCAKPHDVCVPRSDDACSARSVDTCEADSQCQVIHYACPAVCEDDGHGGCKPCNAPPSHCAAR